MNGFFFREGFALSPRLLRLFQRGKTTCGAFFGLLLVQAAPSTQHFLSAVLTIGTSNFTSF